MFAGASLPIHPDTLYQLLDHLREAGSPLSPAEAADLALRDWLSTVRAKRDKEGAILHGYRWKQLFLPEGTRLRVWLRHEHGHAEVIGDELTYEGRAVSPNEYVRCCAGTHRNAWELISILLPGAPKWIPATVLRRQGSAGQPNECAPAPAPPCATEPAIKLPPAPRPKQPNQKLWGERRGWNLPGRRETDCMPEQVFLDH